MSGINISIVIDDLANQRSRIAGLLKPGAECVCLPWRKGGIGVFVLKDAMIVGGLPREKGRP
jgi:hypothetical protein